MKVVIPVAGLGTRMLPATKSIPKEMLPIADRPLIQLIVNECAKAGAKEIIFVTHSSKSAIENHFDTSFELESMLEKRVKRQLLEEVQSITPKGVKLIYVRQGYAKGLGHAVLCAKSVIGNNEPFAVVLPDVVMDEYSSDLAVDNLAIMIKRYHETGISQIMVNNVSIDEVENYGIANVNDREFIDTDFLPIINIIEKPEKHQAPSTLSIVGRYVFSPELWHCLEQTPIGIGDEIQLTDAVDLLLKKHPVEAYLMKGKSYDCGNKLGYWECFVEHAIRDKKFGKEFKKHLEDIVSKHEERIVKIS